METRWRRAFLLSTTLLSIGVLLWGIVPRWQELQSYHWQFDWALLLLSSVSFSLSMGLTCLAWVLTMRALQVNSTWRQDVKFFFFSWLARVLPTPGPYLASRVLFYEEIGVSKRLVSMGLVWEYVLLVASGALLGLLLLPLTPLIQNQSSQGLVIVAAASSLLFVVRPLWLARLINAVLQRFGQTPLTVLIDQRAAFTLLLIYSLVWLGSGLVLFLLIRAIYPLAWSALPLVIHSSIISGLVAYLAFFAPAGFGLREVALALLLVQVVPMPVAVLAALLTRLWTMLNELVWALVIARL
jgi:hypothetical protein